MPYTPLQVANTFLTRYADGGGIDHMKLQKLDYFVHGWWLAYNAEKLLTEDPQVWKYGPVFPSLYRELRIFGNQPLTEPVKINPFVDEIPVVSESDKQAINLIDWVWKRYGRLSALTLSELTHKDGTAWKTVAVAKQFRVPEGYPLTEENVRQEFENYKNQITPA